MAHYMLVMHWKVDEGEEKVEHYEFDASDPKNTLKLARKYFDEHYHPYANGQEMPDVLMITKVVDTCPIGKWYVDLQRKAKTDLPAGPLLAVCQDWEESERGWGVRHDGFTLHISSDECKRYITAYYEEHNNQNRAPSCYTRASGSPRLVEVSEDTYLKVKHSGSIWGVGKQGPQAYMP